MFELDKKLIFTIDLDAFFAQVEEMRNPEYKGMPIAVGHELYGRGVVSTCNYKAREKGVKSGMPLFKARKHCPELKLVEADHEYYQFKANEVFDVISKFTNKVEFVSIDECYADLTNMTNKYSPIEIAKIIYNRVLKETGLTVSIGISTNILLSKIASNFDKPSGVSTLYKEEIPNKLWPLKVSKLYMIGSRTEEKLNSFGIVTIGDLANIKSDPAKYALVKREFGINIDKHIEAANGLSTNVVNDKETRLKSASRDKTFPVSITEIDSLKQEARELFEYVLFRSKRRKVMPSSISVAIKVDKSLNAVSRSKKLKSPTIDREMLWPVVSESIETLFQQGMSVRFCSVSFEGLKEIGKVYKQLELIREQEEETKDKISILAEEMSFKHGVEIVSADKMKDNRNYEKKSPIDRDNIKFKVWDK